MNYRILINTVLFIIIASACTTKFLPEIDEYDNIMVVEGLLTNENRANYVKISRTIPVGITGISSPLVDAHVYIRDDLNRIAVFHEKRAGYYASDSLTFRGEIGRTYTLHIMAGGKNYESDPMLIQEVQPIDSLFAEFRYEEDVIYPPLYEYTVYFNSYDPENNNRFFRWTYEEVWEFHLPWHYPPDYKRICWLTEESSEIIIKNNSTVEEAIIDRYPLLTVDNRSSNKLYQRYSILPVSYTHLTLPTN